MLPKKRSKLPKKAHLMSLTEMTKHVLCGFELETQSAKNPNQKKKKEKRSCPYSWCRATSQCYDCEFGSSRKWADLNGVDDETVEAVADCSVKGPEIRTIGGQTPAAFKKALEAVFKNDLKIDEHCSFHVHVSLPGYDLDYGDKFHRALYRGLFDQLERVPKSVLKRWTNTEWLESYFPIAVGSYDRPFINLSDEHETVEFRCFGNVQSVKEGMDCLLIAIKALNYAIKALDADVLGIEAKDFERFGETMTELLSCKDLSQRQKLQIYKELAKGKSAFSAIAKLAKPKAG